MSLKDNSSNNDINAVFTKEDVTESMPEKDKLTAVP